MHLIFQTSYRETQSTLSDPDIYIQYRNFPTAIVRVLYLVHCWRAGEGTDIQKVQDIIAALQIHACGFLSSIAAKAFSYFIS